MISNASELVGGELADLRSLALRVAGAGLEACDVGRATEEAVSPTEAGVRIGGCDYPLPGDADVIVVGAGKATLAIVAALERVLGDRIDRGAIVVREGEDVTRLERVDVLVADHPLPTERSVAGANRLIALAEAARTDDLVIAAFTGGSSALASLPPAGVSTAEKRRLHELLLASGAPIADVNTVRKHVSRIKGGRLAELIAPATLVNLTASDVAGDIIDAITDPTVEDSSTAADAIGVLRERGLWSQVPASVRAHLDRAEARSPTLGLEAQTVLLVTGRGACEAMALEAESAGAKARVVSTELEGEASEIGRMLVRLAGEARNGEVTAEAPRVLVGCGGEATVSLGPDGAFGAGGPNQEAAVAAALALGEAPRSPPAFSTRMAPTAGPMRPARSSTATRSPAPRWPASTSRAPSRPTGPARRWPRSATG